MLRFRDSADWQVTVRAPSARWVCECVAAKNPARLYGLRKDTLGVLLSAANVGTGARVLCLDGCAGLLLGAAAERLGGHGCVSRRANPSPGSRSEESAAKGEPLARGDGFQNGRDDSLLAYTP